MSASGGFAPTAADGWLGELSQEHRFVQPLLERLTELGHNIRSGQPVHPKTARIGVALLDAYLHRVHVGQEEGDLRSEVEYLAGRTFSVHLATMRTQHAEMGRHAQQVLLDIRRWASGDEAASVRVGQGMVELAREDIEAVQYEETYALVWFRAGLPEPAGRRLQQRLAQHQGTRRALEGRIGRFLAGTYLT
ncbi:MAG: hypothetical protein ACYCPN_02610 [Thermoplasmata archaeon]